MKKLLKLVLIAAAVLCCLSFAACEQRETTIIHTVRTVGTYSGYRVDCVWFEHKDANVVAVVEEYTVDDVYIQTFPDPSYKYLVYLNDKDWVHLNIAYEEGLITYDDLLAIAEAEAPYDNLKNDEEW